MNNFRHSGQRDDRRRRVLNDELLGRGPAESSPALDRAPARSAKRNHHYSEAASMDAQPRVTDLVPKKIGTFALLLFAGVLLVAGLQGLYAWMPRLAGMTSDGRVAAFDLDSEGSLGAWFSSLLLALSGLAAVLVWSLRRHRMDDYHGRYRIWLWTAGVWFVMSIDEACSLHEGFKELMTASTGHRLFGDGSVWWVGAYLIVLSWLAFRLLMEMRGCRTSISALALAGICWVVAVATQLELLLPQSGAVGVMLEEGLEMAGDLLILFAMTFHARHVILDAQGLLSENSEKPKKERKRKAASNTDGETSDSKPDEQEPPKRSSEKKLATTSAMSSSSSSASAAPATSTRSASTKPATVAATRPTTPASKPAASGPSATRVDPPSSLDESRRLSKAERRALRRQEREVDE